MVKYNVIYSQDAPTVGSNMPTSHLSIENDFFSISRAILSDALPNHP